MKNKFEYNSGNILRIFKEYRRFESVGYSTGDARLIELKMDLDLILETVNVSDRHLDMFIMFYIEHMKQTEIAEHYGIRQPTVNEYIKNVEKAIVQLVKGWEMSC